MSDLIEKSLESVYADCVLGLDKTIPSVHLRGLQAIASHATAQLQIEVCRLKSRLHDSDKTPVGSTSESQQFDNSAVRAEPAVPTALGGGENPPVVAPFAAGDLKKSLADLLFELLPKQVTLDILPLRRIEIISKALGDHATAQLKSSLQQCQGEVERLKSQISEWNGRMFPVMSQGIVGAPSRIPWAWIAPFNGQAQNNHGGQSLQRLAERGGLSVCELMAVVENRPWRRMNHEEAATAIVAWTEKQSERGKELTQLRTLLAEARVIVGRVRGLRMSHPEAMKLWDKMSAALGDKP